MKKTIILACAALVMSAAAVMGYKTYNESKQLTLMDANIEALTQNEWEGWAKGFHMTTVWYKKSMEISYTRPVVTFGWNSMDCCCNSNDSNACNFNNEDPRCKTYIVRNQRP